MSPPFHPHLLNKPLLHTPTVLSPLHYGLSLTSLHLSSPSPSPHTKILSSPSSSPLASSSPHFISAVTLSSPFSLSSHTYTAFPFHVPFSPSPAPPSPPSVTHHLPSLSPVSLSSPSHNPFLPLHCPFFPLLNFLPFVLYIFPFGILLPLPLFVIIYDIYFRLNLEDLYKHFFNNIFESEVL